jgi:hypothetical protein
MFGGLEVNDKNKMGKMTSLGKLSGIKKRQPKGGVSPYSVELSVSPTLPETAAILDTVATELPIEPIETKVKVSKKTTKKQKQDKPVTVNIKIRKDQKDWLADTASQVRENNLEPVPPAERVYPQHLIGVAIDLLQNMNVDWGEIKNVEQLREYLNL